MWYVVFQDGILKTDSGLGLNYGLIAEETSSKRIFLESIGYET